MMATRRRRTKGKAASTPRAQEIRSPFDVGKPGGADRWAGPFLLPLAVLPAIGQAGHMSPLGSLPLSALTGLVGLAGGPAVGYLAWHQTAARRPLLRWHVAISVTAGITSTAMHCIAGPGASWWWPMWVLGGAIAGVTWCIPRVDSVRGTGEDTHAQTTGADELLGLPGVTAKCTSRSDERETWRVTAKDGQGAPDIARALGKIEAMRHLPPGSARAIPHPDDAATATVSIVTRDLLRETMRWPGPSCPGGSIAEPVITGRYDTGELVAYWLFGDRSQGRNAPAAGLTAGVPGSGKTEEALVMAGEILTRTDVVLWWSDTLKGAQTVAPISEGIDWLVSDAQGTTAMLAAIDALARYNADWLGAHGYKEWEQGCGIPATVVHFEEAARVFGEAQDPRQSERLARLSEAVRSTGIFVEVSMQRASGSNIPTDARANIGLAKCFGVRELRDAQMVLSAEILEAGAQPWVWRNHRPGYMHLEAPGIDLDRSTLIARSYLADVEQLRQAVEDAAPYRARLTPGQADAAGPAYAGRSDTTTVQATTGPGTTQTSTVDIEEEDDMEPLPERPEDIADLMDEVDPRSEIDTTGLENVRFGAVEDERLTPAQRDEVFARIVTDLVAQKGGKVTMEDLAASWMATPGIGVGMRPALYRRLGHLVKAGIAYKSEDEQATWIIDERSWSKAVGTGRERIPEDQQDTESDDEEELCSV